MGFLDIFKVNSIKEERDSLKNRVAELEEYLTPELKDLDNVVALTKKEEKRLSDIKSEIALDSVRLQELKNNIDNVHSDLAKKKIDLEKQIGIYEEKMGIIEFSLYEPTYDFVNSDTYNEKLKENREKQKELLKSGKACDIAKSYTLDGSAAKGAKMMKDIEKLLMKTFNVECEDLVRRVKYSNYESFIDRIYKERDSIEKLGGMFYFRIKPQYMELKIAEIKLAFEYQVKKQEEKEAAKEARAEMREAAKLQKEIEEQRKKVEKEQKHFQNALVNVMKQLKNATPEESAALEEKKAELEAELGVIAKSISDIDYREANQKAGYVYVISNIGAFGENVYKIGMTRRLDPQERIDELGDASVPFDFDVHAMIFSDNAPALEAALHKAFEDRKVNMVNTRREFFNVTLDEIKEVVKKNYDKTVEFFETPEAEQYRISLKMKELTH